MLLGLAVGAAERPTEWAFPNRHGFRYPEQTCSGYLFGYTRVQVSRTRLFGYLLGYMSSGIPKRPVRIMLGYMD